jgi:hypothetical protein
MADEEELPTDFGGLANSEPFERQGYAAVVGPDTSNAHGYEVSTFALKKPPAPKWRLPLEKPRKADGPLLPPPPPGA